MKIGDSVRFNFSEFPGLPKKDFTLDESIEHNRQEREYEKTFNAPKKFKRYMIELHGKGSVAERNIYNIPGEEIKDGETATANKKASGKQKLKDLGLNDDEINALMGV